MKTISTEIQINAPKDKVWAVLTDFGNWALWNPSVHNVEGESGIGKSLSITMNNKNGEPANSYKPTIIELDDFNRLRWKATMMAGFLFSNYRVFELQEKDGGTHLVNKEEFEGLLVPVFCKNMEKFIVPMLNKMNEELKKKVEASA